MIRSVGISDLEEISNRRSFFKGAVGTAAAFVAAACTSSQNSAKKNAVKTYVLVHGAWHGGWCWRYVREKLQAQGHRVFTPTMTGVGERSHLLNPDIGLDTHIEDIVRHIEFEELREIILVGHSYGGMVITGVVDQLKDRISHIVYLDAAVPEDGDHFGSQSPNATPESISQYELGTRSMSQDGIAMDVFPPSILGILETDKANTEWVAKHMTPHPLKSWLDPIKLANNGSEGVPRTYIHCTTPALQGASFAAHYDLLRQDKTWAVKTLKTGHDAMVTMPGELTEILTTL